MSGIVISGMVRSSWSVSSAGTSSCSSNVSTSSGTVSSVSVRSFTFIGSGLKSKEESISSKLNGSSSAPDEAASSCGSSESSPALESSGASFGIFSSDSPSSKSGLLNWPNQYQSQKNRRLRPASAQKIQSQLYRMHPHRFWIYRQN